MIPIIYDSNETVFSSNGLGRLRDCTECRVTEERNGVYECDFSVPVDGANFGLVQIGRTIGVRHDDSDDIQPFDIVSYSKPIDGVVDFHAVHISYRQSGLVARGTGITSLSAALSMLKTSAQPDNPFVYTADFESNAYMASADGTPRSVRQFLGGIEGSILDAYGGEYEFDKYSVILHKSRGVGRDFSIKYGVTMLDFKDDTDALGAYSSCIPFWKGDNTIVVGARVDSGLPTASGRNDCVPLDLSEKFEGRPTTTQLQNMALSVMQSRQPNLPKSTINVDFVRLQDMGVDWLGALYQCKLCDTINVEFPKYNMAGRFKIVKTVFNVLEGRFEKMELGTLSTTLSQALGISDTLGGTSSGGGGSVDEATAFVGTRSNAITRGDCYGMYDPNAQTVTLVYHFYNTSDIPTSYTLFTIPEEYRPTTARYGGCFYTTSDPSYISYQGYVTNGGIVRQGLSSKVRSGFGVIKYILN